MRLLIVADDFTGALDTGVQFARKGIKTLAALRFEAVSPAVADTCEVLSVNLDTRHDTPDAAYHKVRDILAAFQDVPFLYMKTDSVLRGNISASFRAVLDVKGGPIMFLPAYPESGRITVNGTQYVGGIPLEQSSFARDPLNPCKKSYIPDILREHFPVECQITGETEENPCLDCFGQVVVFDCTGREQLEKRTGFLHQNNMLRVTAGCAGFAEALAERLAFQKEETNIHPAGGSTLYLSGSVGETTFRQLAAIKNTIPVFTIPDAVKLRPENNPEWINATVSKLLGVLGGGSSAILATALAVSDLPDMPDHLHRALQSLFADVAQQLVLGGRVKNIAIFGGDTAMAIFERLGLDIVRPLMEIQPGVPVSTASGKVNITVVTKSGGLGQKNVINAIEDYLGDVKK